MNRVLIGGLLFPLTILPKQVNSPVSSEMAQREDLEAASEE